MVDNFALMVELHSTEIKFMISHTSDARGQVGVFAMFCEGTCKFGDMTLQSLLGIPLTHSARDTAE
jgi:hypothetical protein